MKHQKLSLLVLDDRVARDTQIVKGEKIGRGSCAMIECKPALFLKQK
jgi:hypothetical protein